MFSNSKQLKLIDSNKYRKDIDGLRAIAVLPVLFFHLGIMNNGYLGVDIFFVISGYLITGIIYSEIKNNNFSIVNFYIRRTRRIIPLVSFICFISLIIGIIYMLPDDLENLAQSVIATNFFSNNILQTLTTKNYWDVVNEFKPLMHTWSLGIEEQYYLIYPFIFLLFGKKRVRFILPILIIAAITSLILYLLPLPEFKKFYLLQFRFYELAIGGIAAIILKRKLISHHLSSALLIALILLLTIEINAISDQLELLICVALTTLILISDNTNQIISKFILTNQSAILIGKISFSLYMWHQVIFAFSRYFVFQDISNLTSFSLIAVIFILSYLSYTLIEQPFRNKSRFSNKSVFILLSLITILTTTTSFYIYKKAGVLKDIPELGIEKNKTNSNMHAQYNDHIYTYDKEFPLNGKINVLILGNSFARDWANVLLKSTAQDKINVSYIYNPKNNENLSKRSTKSDLIFISSINKQYLTQLKLDSAKVWCVGTKNFGKNNGYFYNQRNEQYCTQRTKMEDGYIESNTKLKFQWKSKYIDLIQFYIDKDKTVPIFTPECKFISQDCRHFTEFGAQYMANLLEKKIDSIIKSAAARKLRITKSVQPQSL